MIKNNLTSIQRHPWLITAGIILCYCVISLAAYWPLLPASNNRISGCACGDLVQSVWFLRWTPYALFHGQNPLYTDYLNVPSGANLSQNTLMPLLGILAAPLTALAGPVASLNFLAWLAFPASATAMFYAARRITGSRLAAFIAGLLYGFSPYMVGQGGGHIMLSFIPLPPLIVLAMWQLCIKQGGNPIRIGILIAAEAVAQFFIDPEPLAIISLVIGMAMAIVLLFEKEHITRERIQYAGRGLLITLSIAGIVLAYPIWFMTFGPNHFTGPNFGPGNPYRSDLLGLIIPTPNEKIVPRSLSSFSTRAAGGDYPETGDYIGVILLAVIIAAVIRWRHNRWILLSAILALSSWILSLGPRLTIYGHKTVALLPFAVFTKLPLLQDILPSRLSMAEWLCISLLVALCIAEWQREQKTTLPQLNWWVWPVRSIALLAILASVFTLLPGWPYKTVDIQAPKLFTSDKLITPNNTVALTYPYPVFPNDQAMLWQATSGIHFRLLGGYIQNRAANGQESEMPSSLYPMSVQTWLSYEQQSALLPATTPPSRSDMRSFLLKYKVDLVLVDPSMINASQVISVLHPMLGKPEVYGGMLVWSHVHSNLN